MQKAAVEVNVNKRTEMIQINVGANLTNIYNFGQLPNLKQATKIVRIEAFDNTQVPLTTDGKGVITPTILKKSYLKLVEVGRSNAEIHVIPLWDLQQSSANLIVKDLNCQTIDWEKSTWLIPEITGLSVTESLLLKVEYIKG